MNEKELYLLIWKDLQNISLSGETKARVYTLCYLLHKKWEEEYDTFIFVYIMVKKETNNNGCL